MNKLYSRTSLVVLAMGISLSGWAANPCLPIAMPCMKMGFYKGGDKIGKGLIKDCVMPVIAGKKTLPNTSFSNEVLQACKADIMSKMEKRAMDKQNTAAPAEPSAPAAPAAQ